MIDINKSVSNISNGANIFIDKAEEMIEILVGQDLIFEAIRYISLTTKDFSLLTSALARKYFEIKNFI